MDDSESNACSLEEHWCDVDGALGVQSNQIDEMAHTHTHKYLHYDHEYLNSEEVIK